MSIIWVPIIALNLFLAIKTGLKKKKTGKYDFQKLYSSLKIILSWKLQHMPKNKSTM